MSNRATEKLPVFTASTSGVLMPAWRRRDHQAATVLPPHPECFTQV